MNHIGDFRAAGKRVRVETLVNGRWFSVRGELRIAGGLESLIQTLADEGYDCLGKIDEYIPTSTLAAHTEDFLFVRQGP